MRLLLPLALFLCCISIAHADPNAILDLPRLEENYGLTYRVESTSDGVRWGHGTGWVLWRDGYLVTQYHVVEDATLVVIRVRKDDGTVVKLPANVVAEDRAHDLVILHVQHRFAGEMELEDPSTLRNGDLVYSVGYPYSAGKSVDRGWIRSMDLHANPEDPDHSVTDRIFLEIPNGHGTSGSAIFSMRTGRVIGSMKAYVQFGRESAPLFVRITTPITKIVALAESADIPYRSATHRADHLRIRNPRR